MTLYEQGENKSRELSIVELQQASFEAVAASMTLIRDYQVRVVEMGGTRVKPDESLVTEVDDSSEATQRDILLRRAPGVPIVGEEGVRTQDDGLSRYIILVDPLDGTRNFTSGGMDSSVLNTVFDRERGVIVAATIGIPSSGSIWQVTEGNSTLRTVIDLETGEPLHEPIECHVWEGEFERSATMFIDNLSPHTRNGRLILDKPALLSLYGDLCGNVAILNLGSNGTHHALVANGNDKVVGAITSALGGEWDTAGVLAVLSAGGVARGFKVTESRTLEEVDPLRPFKYDTVVVANNNRTLGRLSVALTTAMPGKQR